jgi:hypothetical protein
MGHRVYTKRAAAHLHCAQRRFAPLHCRVHAPEPHSEALDVGGWQRTVARKGRQAAQNCAQLHRLWWTRKELGAAATTGFVYAPDDEKHTRLSINQALAPDSDGLHSFPKAGVVLLLAHASAIVRKGWPCGPLSEWIFHVFLMCVKLQVYRIRCTLRRRSACRVIPGPIPNACKLHVSSAGDARHHHRSQPQLINDQRCCDSTASKREFQGKKC